MGALCSLLYACEVILLTCVTVISGKLLLSGLLQ